MTHVFREAGTTQESVEGDYYERVLESIPYAFVYCQILFENSNFKDLVALKCNDDFKKLVAGKEIEGTMVSSILPGILETIKRLYSPNRSYRFETQMGRQDCYFRVIAYPKGEYLLVLLEDITEWKQLENELAIVRAKDKESENANKALLESLKRAQRIAKIGSWDWDLRTNKVYWSDETFKIFGVTPKEHIPDFKTNTKFIHPDDLREYSEKFAESLKTGCPLDYDTRILCPNGTVKFCNARGTVRFDESGRPVWFSGTVMDISERKRSEDLLQRSQKLESLGVLAGGIAHDFNNLLGGLYGYLDLALYNLQRNNADSAREQISKALDIFERTKGLTQQLLTFAKGGAPVRKTVDVLPTIRGNAQFALSGSNVLAVFNIQSDLWPCYCDLNQIGQVIDNIVINAKEAMPDGGVLEITVNNVVPGGEEIDRQKHPGDYIKISIQDHGAGIPKEMQSRIYDPFFTTKTSGHGLGLATVYSIVNRHEGWIEVDSKIGRGTTFHIFLPASASRSADSSSSSSKASPGTSGSGRE